MTIELLHPLPGAVVTQTYAEHVARNLPRYNGGLDLAIPGSPGGDKVICASPGQVIRVGSDPGGYGNFAKVRHSAEYETLYAHLQLPPIVELYASVSAGSVLGYVGSTGNSTGPHLHFELRQDGKPIDPAPYLTPAQAPAAAAAAAAAVPATVMRVIAHALNVRTGPGTGYPKVGTLNYGQVVPILELQYTEAWIQIADGRWCALSYHGTPLLEEVNS